MANGPAQQAAPRRHTLLDAVERQAVLAAGLAWLYHTPQPDGAIVQHGPSLATGDRVYTFHPAGPGDTPVVVVNVRHPRYEHLGCERVLTNPLNPRELAEVAAALSVLGVTVVDRWNGTHETGSLRLADPAHPSLLAAHRRYRDQCPRHRTVFCGRGGQQRGADCPWYRAGAALLVPPTHPFGDPPAAAVVTVDDPVVTAGSARVVTATDTLPATPRADNGEARCRPPTGTRRAPETTTPPPNADASMGGRSRTVRADGAAGVRAWGVRAAASTAEDSHG